MQQFTIFANEYLHQDTTAFFHVGYIGYEQPGNPDYINTLKNTYGDYSEYKLKSAMQELRSVLLDGLPHILNILQLVNLTVCVVPRAKAESRYKPSQLCFKSTVSEVACQLHGFVDGTDYIVRHTNTKTTHLPPHTPNYTNDGQAPYPGITAETCRISDEISDKDILLIDDIYTRKVNIDEDAIQALLDKEPSSVTFYAVGRTV